MESPFDNGAAAPLPDSLWASTTPAGTQHSPLAESVDCDVTIIGSGFTGLSAALTLAEAGKNVVVLEASETGWGASGRNNGLIAPGLKQDPNKVVKILGDRAGEELVRYSGDAPTRLARLIADHNIDCDLNTNGWIQAAHSGTQLRQIESRVKQWQDRSADIEMMPSQDVARRLGTQMYSGALIDRRGGSLNPLAYVRGLDRAASASGASIYWRSPVTSISRAGAQWIVSTGSRKVTCDTVLICTNAYGQLSQTRGRLLPLRTAQVASSPLDPDLCRTILPGNESCSDTQRLLTSFRITADKRLIMGGASATAGDHYSGLTRRLHAAAALRFPQLGRIEWEFGWSGYLALTPDHLPIISQHGESCYSGTGCNGRGIAMSTSIGQCLAALALGEEASSLPVPVRDPGRFAGYSLRKPGVAVAVRFNRLLDRFGV